MTLDTPATERAANAATELATEPTHSKWSSSNAPVITLRDSTSPVPDIGSKTMFFKEPSYTGGEITDPEIVEKLPQFFRELLQHVNGCILFNGGLHIRGAVVSPPWHSLGDAWLGEIALHRLFPAIQQQDIPFGQDCFGDQFVLRDGAVQRLQAETGDIENLAMDMETFLLRAQEAPVEFLSLNPLQQFRGTGGELKPGEWLSVYPPFCTKESAGGVSLRAIAASDRIRFLADFARQISHLPEGTKVQIKASK